MKSAVVMLLVAALPAAASVGDDLRTAQQLLWSHRYAEAERAYRAIVRAHPGNVDALKGVATAEYWSGDFRSARRDFAAVLRLRLDDADARKAVREIDAASAPIVSSSVDATSDDQPMRRSVATIAYTTFSDPLTTWTATAGTYSLAARSLGFGSGTAPFASLAGATTMPRQHLRGSASVRLLRFPDGRSEPLGGIAVARVWPHASLQLELDRHEILYTASSLRTHPFETAATAAWSRATDASSSAANVRTIRYFDRNRGVAFDVYHLARIAYTARSSLSVGAAAAYRDTKESRFVDGRYDPYWTPMNLREARAIVAAALGVRNAAIHLHADAGLAHDDFLAQTFHPWRASADIDFPLRDSFRATAGIERQSTAFYRATSFRLGVSGRL